MSRKTIRHARIIMTVGIMFLAAHHHALSRAAAQEQAESVPAVRWLITENFDKNDPHDPLVVDNRVIVGTDLGRVRAYECRDGSPVWVYRFGGRVYYRPSTDGKQVYFSSSMGVGAVQASDGVEVWNFPHEHCDGPTLALADKLLVYVAGSDGILYALNSNTGDVQWESEFVSDAPADPPGFSGEQARFDNTKARPTALASDGETIYLSVFDQCRIVAINASDGKRRWSFQSNGWVHGSAVATAQHVYFGSQDKHFYCLDKTTGEKVWSYETKSRVESGGAVDDDSVYFGSCDGHLYCLAQSSGEVRWKFAADRWKDRSTPIYSVPILAGKHAVFAAGEGQAYAVDRQTGQLAWKSRPAEDAELFCSPATDGERFFLVTRPTIEGKGAPALLAIGSP